MNAQALPVTAETDSSESDTENSETANDRFKKRFESWLWGSMITATVFHFMLFQFWPTRTAVDLSLVAEELEVIELPPDIEIPPPPAAISRPATPVMALTQIDEDITIAPTTFETNPVEALPPPPTGKEEVDVSAAPVFTPMTVRPELKNRVEVGEALMRLYPPLLRNAGIGGEVVVWCFLSDEGTVLDTRVSQTSGYAQLDEAALEVANLFRFTPALNRDRVVQVWIQIPIMFQVRASP